MAERDIRGRTDFRALPTVTITPVGGPSSALYGNYATGGALNFRTRPGGGIEGVEYGAEAGETRVQVLLLQGRQQAEQVGVDIHLQDLYPVAHLLGHLLDNRRDHTAGGAPGGPEVDQHRLAGLQHHGLGCDLSDGLHAEQHRRGGELQVLLGRSLDR